MSIINISYGCIERKYNQDNLYFMGDSYDIIRQNLELAIKNSKLSRTKVGELSGVSYQHLTRFLNNTRGGAIGIDILQRISKTLGIPVSALVGDTVVDKNTQQWNLLIQKAVQLPKDEQEHLFKIISAIIDTYQ
jgi:transcriptional regulator with XRE-family HTH domain